MTETADPPAKPKRVTRKYSSEERLKAVQLYADGMTQPAISVQLGIPQQTICTWLQGIGTGSYQHGLIKNRLKDSIKQAVAKVTGSATAEVQSLLDDSIRVGRMCLLKAELVANACNGRKHVGSLLQATTVAEKGIGIARKALGLNDTTESVIVRVDLVGKVNQAEPIDITPACGVSEQALTLTPTPSNTTSENKQ